jgi:GT2 family glycosyltransferase
VETDPVQLQIELAQNAASTVEFLEPHAAYFTFAENLGQAECALPVDSRFRFRSTRQPVVIDFWRPHGLGDGEAFTTIGNWKQPWREVNYRGEVYSWSKHLEFLKVLDLPERSGRRLEPALANLPDEDRKKLLANGWNVRDALEFSSDIDEYRRFVATSRGEFTVAKDQNVRMRTGWFSDRSATYLASGRPVVTQDTGFGSVLPTGKGLLAFSTPEEAAVALDEIESDYAGHRRAAAEIAEEYFAAAGVLGRLLDEVGVSTPNSRGTDSTRPIAASAETRGETDRIAQLPESLILTPDSRRPISLPETTVKTVLARPMPPPGRRPLARVDVSIIVPTVDNLVFARMCVESILANTGNPHLEVVVVDDGSTDGTGPYLREMAVGDSRIRPLSLPRNRGFAAAVNRGLEAAGGAVFVVLNDDTIVPPGWLARLTRHLDDPAVGLVGPLTNRSGNEQEIRAEYETYGQLLAFVRELETRGTGSLEDMSTLAMFCTAMRRDLYERVGQLDERFGLGMFEDDDYAMRVRAAGHRVVCATGSFVHHFGQGTLGKLAPTGELGTLFHENRRRFERKWGVAWETHRRRPDSSYEHEVARTREVASLAIPDGSRVLVATGGDDRFLSLGRRNASHFPRLEDGTYAGHHPADGAEAVAELDRWRRDGFEYLVVPDGAGWWLDHYVALREYLTARASVAAREPGTCVIYALSDGDSPKHGDPAREKRIDA